MIKNFTCNGFRNITCSDLEFARINILIGPNNAGKSNFIRALSFAANMVNNQKSDSTGFLSEIKRNGWDQIANKHTDKSAFRLSWEFETEKGRPVKYTLGAIVGKKREDNYITEETLDSTEPHDGYPQAYNYFKCHVKDPGPGPGKGLFSTAGFESTKSKRLPAKVDNTESVILQMDNLFFSYKEMFSTPFVRDNIRQVLESMRKYFKSFYSYSCAAFNISEIRDLRDAQGEGSVLAKDASNFVNVFYTAMSNDVGFKNRYLKMLKRLIAKCEDIRVESAGTKIWMEIKIDGYYFPLSEVSDGTIHLLVLLLMLNLSKQNAISLLAIDEPEMNLHPAWQKQLANEILRGHGFKQCFISTHSPDFLDEFTEDFLNENAAVFVFDPSSKTSIRKLDPQELRGDLAEWTLGDLYRIGDPAIGGWPQ